MQLSRLKPRMPICKICFEPIEDSLHHLIHRNTCICHKCFERFEPKLETFNIGPIKGMFVFHYDQTIQELLYQFKGCADIELSQVFLEYFRDFLWLRYHGFTIVPAPSSKEGDEKRGFNHVVEIFSHLKLPMIRCVHKTKNIKQADLTAEQRKDVKKILTIDNIDLTSKRILIVDDVYTTGSTIRAMIDLVQGKHPKEIKVLVMSKTMELDDQNRPN